MRLIDRMAFELYEALHNRQHCTACGGEGVVITRMQPESSDELDILESRDILLSNICGCVKHTEALLKRYTDEHVLLATLAEQDQDAIEAAALKEYGGDGK